MRIWIIEAFVSMFFAGLTSVIAKKGLEGISSDLGLMVRTIFVFVFTAMFTAATVSPKEFGALKLNNWIWLAASAATTTLSWIFYYRAVKAGEISTVALIDKGSIIIAFALACVVFHEAVSKGKLVGLALIAAGLFVIART